jgi:hypothetical protein
MNSWWRIFICLLLVITAALANAGDWGGRGWRRERSFGRAPSSHSYGESLDEVVSGLRRRNAGRVLSADTVQEEGRSVHRIRILNDQGRVRGLRFDGATGRPLPRYGRSHSRRHSR